MSYWGGTSIGAVDQDGTATTTTHSIYGSESTSYALGIRADSATGRGLFIRGGSNDNYESFLVTGYDENNKQMAIMGGGTVIFGEDTSGNLAGLSGTKYQFNGGRLGISKAFGTAKADLLDLQSSVAGGGTQPMIRFGTWASNSNTMARIGVVDIPSYGGGFVVETNSSGGASDTTTEKFRIDKDGNVGILTASPKALLQVGTATGSDPTTTANIMSISANRAFTSGYSGQLLVQPSDYGQDYGGMITFGMHRASSLASPLPVCAIAGRKEEGTGGNYSAYLHFGTRANGGNITEKMRITSVGNVGIGTTSPNARLEIEDNATGAGMLLKITADDSSPYGIIIGNDTWSTTDTHGLRMWIQNDGTGQIMARGSGDENLILNRDGGNVGIGTTSPDTNLGISSATEAWLRINSDNDSNSSDTDCGIYFSVNANSIKGLIKYDEGDDAFCLGYGTDKDIAIKSNGSVGIGTISPGYKLEVTGTFYSAGSSATYKENIEDLEVDSSLIHSLRAVSYDYKKEYKDFGYNVKEGKQLGLISEEVAETIPELAIMKDGRPKNVDYQKLAVVLLAEVQNLKKDIEELKK